MIYLAELDVANDANGYAVLHTVLSLRVLLAGYRGLLPCTLVQAFTKSGHTKAISIFQTRDC